MERDLARHLIRTAFGTARELRILLTMLKQHLGEQEYKSYALGIAGAIDAINVALIDPTLTTYPELKDEIEASLEKYDRYL